MSLSYSQYLEIIGGSSVVRRVQSKETYKWNSPPVNQAMCLGIVIKACLMPLAIIVSLEFSIAH